MFFFFFFFWFFLRFFPPTFSRQNAIHRFFLCGCGGAFAMSNPLYPQTAYGECSGRVAGCMACCANVKRAKKGRYPPGSVPQQYMPAPPPQAAGRGFVVNQNPRLMQQMPQPINVSGALCPVCLAAMPGSRQGLPDPSLSRAQPLVFFCSLLTRVFRYRHSRWVWSLRNASWLAAPSRPTWA